MNWHELYASERARLVDDLDQVVQLEAETQDTLVDVILSVAPEIKRDWQHSLATRPQWIETAPKQRGRGPRGTQVPWIEVAEYVPLSHVNAELGRRGGSAARFPGLPYGGDLRYADSKMLLHFDAKAAGPTDLHSEIVVPPYQVSGDGLLVTDGAMAPEPSLKNSFIPFRGRKQKAVDYRFYPSLPPLYVDGSTTRICITAFVKVVYDLRTLGDQPLAHMTLAMVPNGLLLFGQELFKKPGLFAPGKDDAKKSEIDRRARVLFNGLRDIADWRVVRIAPNEAGHWDAEAGMWEPEAITPKVSLGP